MKFINNRLSSFFYLLIFLSCSSILSANTDFFCKKGSTSIQYYLDETTNTVSIVANNFDKIKEFVISDAKDKKEYTWRTSADGIDYINIDYPDIDMWVLLLPSNGYTRDSNGNETNCVIVSLKLQCSKTTYFFGKNQVGTLNNDTRGSGIRDYQFTDTNKAIIEYFSTFHEEIDFNNSSNITRRSYDPISDKIINDVVCETL